MSAPAEIALLPAGLRDGLPDEAAHEARVVEQLLACFGSHGYQRVKPPLVEFEDTLVRGSGAAMAGYTFRLMDPVSQHMMGVRADMTLQVARIATTRLGGAPRPLRLSYAGEVLRVRATQLVPERQLVQVGVEIIGAPPVSADAEVVLLAAEALGQVGMDGISVDLTAPTLVPVLCGGLDIEAGTAAGLREALDHKDAAGVAAAAGAHGALFQALLAAAGPAEEALARLEALALLPAAAAEVGRLARVVALIRAGAPTLGLTVDPVENRGFEYHTGTSFAIFARGARGELGRGGRYLAGPAPGEAATGFTFTVEIVLRALPAPEAGDRLFLPFGTPGEAGRRLREKGWVALAGLEAVADVEAEAGRMRCSHVLIGGIPRALERDAGG